MDTYVRRPIATNEAGGAAGDDFLVKAEGGYVKLEADLYIKLKAPVIKLVSLPSSETSSSSNELSSGRGGEGQSAFSPHAYAHTASAENWQGELRRHKPRCFGAAAGVWRRDSSRSAASTVCRSVHVIINATYLYKGRSVRRSRDAIPRPASAFGVDAPLQRGTVAPVEIRDRAIWIACRMSGRYRLTQRQPPAVAACHRGVEGIFEHAAIAFGAHARVNAHA